MGESVDFIKDRALKTISAAKKLAPGWVWQEKTIEQLQAELTAITGDSSATPPVVGQEEVVCRTEQVMLAARGVWDTQLDILHRWTVQGIGMAKTRHRDDPAVLAVLSPLAGNSNSRSETLKEALAWESAWARVDPAWSPLPANTFTNFKTLRRQCAEPLQTTYSDARTAWRAESGKLAGLAAALEALNEAWYADATRVFPVGTPEGEMIRSTVPTTYTAPAEAAPAKASAPSSPAAELSTSKTAA